jgi:hypothetical protein
MQTGKIRRLFLSKDEQAGEELDNDTVYINFWDSQYGDIEYNGYGIYSSGIESAIKSFSRDEAYKHHEPL